jgi:glycosyltransferase involved in cell wall biosynthesis
MHKQRDRCPVVAERVFGVSSNEIDDDVWFGPTRRSAARRAPSVPSGATDLGCPVNGARFLEAQLESYLAQTRLPDELVACDDDSTDGTRAILEAFAKRAPFPVRLDRNPTRLGSTKNFEKAIRLCTGDLIATSDQDDIWLPHKLAFNEAGFDVEPARGLVFSDADVVDEELRPLGHTMWDAIHLGPIQQWRVRKGEAFEVLLRQWLVTGATMMFRASYLPYVLPIPENWIHDGWIAFIIGALAPVGLLDTSTVQYRQHATQQIGGKKLGWRELYDLAKTVGPEHFRLAYERFTLAAERLRAFAPRLRDARYLPMIERKVEHQRRRLAIAESHSRVEKVAWTLDELARWGYQRYSPVTTHCLKDLLF